VIFVVTGTEIHPFDRLIREVDRLRETGAIKDEVFVQLGHTRHEPKSCRWERFIGFGEMCEAIQSADLVVAHAGAGTALLCLQYRKRPILVPRRPEFGEHIDAHQHLFAMRLHQMGLASTVLDIEGLSAAIAGHHQRVAAPGPATELVQYLETIAAEWHPVSPRRGSPPRRDPAR
jgi:UDP-N-acetylglucosamine transferase subunit ALG13